MYETVVVSTVVMHFAFIAYVLAGGFLALRWRRTMWLHVPAVIWGIGIAAKRVDCPLTWVERWARTKAAMTPLSPDGFVAHYITGVIYPAGWVAAAQLVMFAIVAASWAAVERSPQAAAAHDRAGWVGLFTGDARVEDPVGSQPQVGHEAIGRFYDTFIGPRDITFHRDLDIVSGTVVLRDLELEVAMDSAVTVFIPAFLRYDLRPVTGEWQIAALRAYWELPAMMLQFLRTGSGATRPALQLSRALLGNQGLGGTAGFLTGFRRAGRRHKKLVETFLNAASRADKSAAYHALSRTATMTLGEDELLDIVELFEQLRGASWTKVTGAGSTVAVSLASDHRRGIMFADVPWRGNRINRIRYFPA